uniref:Uncharacterized protein n=1 Tax=Chromera velia CCMP2878 TaxID=1169474 RepID=A0A0G4HW26_9ALVE|eukprot:Cvel_32451.t1-p1 / transcript=Cvel_32451.t1 / gene=Cvel_32451 / organism=Chromera_velia_CCMP2878 / gene_product=hypothetical protein / transcript_product=hypothetical protein / location=Cvel_scaffold5055:2511-2930(+) / protein_length=140 / sequence_SO=supercontig / SO=protein_coding / is_pseudo=false
MNFASHNTPQGYLWVYDNGYPKQVNKHESHDTLAGYFREIPPAKNGKPGKYCMLEVGCKLYDRKSTLQGSSFLHQRGTCVASQASHPFVKGIWREATVQSWAQNTRGIFMGHAGAFEGKAARKQTSQGFFFSIVTHSTAV